MKSPQKMTAKILQDKEARDPLKVGIIGCGRLGSQLAHCLLTYGRVNPKDMKVSTRRPETLGKKFCINHYFQFTMKAFLWSMNLNNYKWCRRLPFWQYK